MTAKKTILIILTPAFNPNAGGVQMSTWKMASCFAGRGYRMLVYSFEQEGHQHAEFATLSKAPDAGGTGSDANLSALARLVDDEAPDIVINQMPYEHRIGDVLRRRRGPLLLGCLRNTLFSVKADLDAYARRSLPGPAHRLFRNRVGRQLLLARHRRRHRADLIKILATYDRFVMFGPPNLEELRYFVPGFDPGRVALVPNSIPAVLDEVPPKEKRLLWLGRITDLQKRADLLAPLWDRVGPALPDWTLDIVGDGPARGDLEAAIARSPHADRVVFHGRQVPDAYYRRAPIFLMTSAWEGFPNTVVEAQSFAAVPVLFDTFPVAGWMAGAPDSASLIAPFDVDAMAQRIIALARDPERPAVMARALENARRFHIDAVGDEWERLFERALSERRVGAAA
jgi:glycosyltransferase involved in cell wall biosynthesis